MILYSGRLLSTAHDLARGAHSGTDLRLVIRASGYQSLLHLLRSLLRWNFLH